MSKITHLHFDHDIKENYQNKYFQQYIKMQKNCQTLKYINTRIQIYNKWLVQHDLGRYRIFEITILIQNSKISAYYHFQNHFISQKISDVFIIFIKTWFLLQRQILDNFFIILIIIQMKILYQTGYFNFAKTKTAIKRVRLGRPGTSLKMGLLGMANIGKSSTFNLLSNLNVPAENIPFCTIDPNEAFITVRDPRFYGLRDLYKPQKQVGPMLRIVDIAGLVKGASQGYGLGNQFLSHVMQVDGLYHVVRCFQGNNIAHTQGDMDPVRDIKIIRHELIQKDLDIITKKLAQFQRKAKKSQDKQIKLQYQIMLKAKQTLKNQIQIRNIAWKTQQIQILNKFLFLTSKPMIYLLNLSKQDYLANKVNNHKQIEEVITENGKFQAKCIPYSVQYQNQRKQQNQSSKTQIDNIIKGGYQQLELIHFYTVGKDEVRAWAIRKGQNAVEAGSKIHSDFGRGFINAQVIHSDVLLKNPEYKQKLQKHSKKQGKTYIVKDGDIVHFNSKIK